MKLRFYHRLGIWVSVFIASYFVNRAVFDLMTFINDPTLALFFAYLCSFIFMVILLAVSVETVVWHHRPEFILPFLLSFGVANWLGIQLKDIFDVPRPFVQYGVDVLVPEYTFSLPSQHAIAVFALLPLIAYKNKWAARLWLMYALIIAFARVYLHVHFLSDVILGAFIGYEVSTLFLWFENKYRVFSRFNLLLKENLEVRRQVLHCFFGLFLVFLLRVYILSSELLGVGLLVAFGLVAFLKYFKFPAFLYQGLAFFEREKHLKRFPARGVLCFLLGSWLATVFFSENIAAASILVLAFGDSVTNIIGRYFGRKKIFYNPRKNWEGTLSGIFFATMGASLFVPLTYAFWASSVAMLVESMDLKIGKFELDDNVLIPVVAGAVLMVVRMG